MATTAPSNRRSALSALTFSRVPDITNPAAISRGEALLALTSHRVISSSTIADELHIWAKTLATVGIPSFE